MRDHASKRFGGFYANARAPEGASTGCGIGGGGSSFVFSAIMRWNPMPTPSMTASRMAHPMAPLRIAFAPPRTASEPPCTKCVSNLHSECALRSRVLAKTIIMKLLRTYREKSRNNGIPRVLLLSYAAEVLTPSLHTEQNVGHTLLPHNRK
jgi:hypothetical protein